MKSDLSKSHSKVSNFKLTLMCILFAIGFGLLFFGLAIALKYQTLGVILICSGCFLSFLMYVFIKAFVR